MRYDAGWVAAGGADGPGETAPDNGPPVSSLTRALTRLARANERSDEPTGIAICGKLRPDPAVGDPVGGFMSVTLELRPAAPPLPVPGRPA
jgi:hypothetical protein